MQVHIVIINDIISFGVSGSALLPALEFLNISRHAVLQKTNSRSHHYTRAFIQFCGVLKVFSSIFIFMSTNLKEWSLCL